MKPCCRIQIVCVPGQVEGNHIKWQNWNIRHSFNYREGLVLHDVSYEDAGKLRPILHRASLVEMCVPYADPNPPFHRKCAFDVSASELGLPTATPHSVKLLSLIMRVPKLTVTKPQLISRRY